MRFLLLNQTFHPDVAATAQYLSELAAALVERGHEVTVLASRRAYDEPSRRFPARENWRGVRIIRVGSPGFGKAGKWRRGLDFAGFLASCFFRMLWLPKHDVAVALTSPPLIAFIAALWSKVRGSRFCYWVMDLNPDEAVAAGWLSAGSLWAQTLEKLSRFSLHHAHKIIVLDPYMQARLLKKGIPAQRLIILPPWSHDADVRFDPVARARFRKVHRLEKKFVVMYSGNHSPCHPLDTLMHAAEKMKGDHSVVFCFIGGGSDFTRLKRWAAQAEHAPVLCLPYQPLEHLSDSLSAADLHAVIMGEPFVGIVHPCKIYNILKVGGPILYIGPRLSHAADLLQRLNGIHARVQHGDAGKVVEAIMRFKSAANSNRHTLTPELRSEFAKDTVIPRLIAALESPSTH